MGVQLSGEALARLMTPIEQQASGADLVEEFIREDILMLLGSVTAWGATNGTVVFHVRGGRIIAERSKQTEGLVWFSFYRTGGIGRVFFWMNESSVADMLLEARDPEKRGDPLVLLCTEPPMA
jgi:hypothetical protein